MFHVRRKQTFPSAAESFNQSNVARPRRGVRYHRLDQTVARATAVCLLEEKQEKTKLENDHHHGADCQGNKSGNSKLVASVS